MTSEAGSFRSADAGHDADRPGGALRTADCLVVGAGPAGAAAAALLARRGHDVLMIDRQPFPRFHVGESLVPETGRWLREIGVYEKVAAAGFPVKRGAFLIAPDGENQRFACFEDALGVEDHTTFEVRRDRFDQILLDHARESGAEIWLGNRAREVDLDGGGVTVRVSRDSGDGDATVRCRYLIDASGRDGFLAKRFGLRRRDPKLEKVGLHAWYEGVIPPPEGHEGDLRLISLEGEGWAWLIPLDERTTSVGAVVGKRRYDALGGSAADGLDALLAAVPALPPLLANARRISDVRIDGDYSYATSEYAGERWLLTGDAGSFLDPVFSTGVLLALSSGVQAARAVDGALTGGAPDRLFAGYAREQRRVYEFFRRFVIRYERPELRDFLVSPAEVLGLGPAITTVLAGNVRPSWSVRLRLQLFFVFIWLQRRMAVVPRLHGEAAPR